MYVCTCYEPPRIRIKTYTWPPIVVTWVRNSLYCITRSASFYIGRSRSANRLYETCDDWVGFRISTSFRNNFVPPRCTATLSSHSNSSIIYMLLSQSTVCGMRATGMKVVLKVNELHACHRWAAWVLVGWGAVRRVCDSTMHIFAASAVAAVCMIQAF